MTSAIIARRIRALRRTIKTRRKARRSTAAAEARLRDLVHAQLRQELKQ